MTTTYTHTAYRPQVGRRFSGRLYGHDMPRPGQTHAANAVESTFRDVLNGVAFERTVIRWRALCGKWVGEHGNAQLASGINTEGVTCRRCRKVLERKGGAA